MRRGLLLFLAVVVSGWLTPLPAAARSHYDEAAAVRLVVMGNGITMDTFEGSPEDPHSLHKYLYCYGNPVNNIDPSGNLVGETLTVSTLSVGLSIAATATIVKTGVAIKQGIDVQALAQRLRVQVKEREDDPQYCYFVHGTSLNTWGPSVELGSRRDFGRGFYTFADDQEGRKWSCIWARQSRHGLLDVPIVIGVKIPKNEFAVMSKMDFRDPALASAWQPSVKSFRSGQRNYGRVGVVIGPVSDGNNDYPQVHPEIKIPQYKFESGVSKLKFAYIYPAWGMLEAGL